MKRTIDGNAYPLDRFMQIDGCRGFILERFTTRDNITERFTNIDLGLNRNLKFYMADALLILVSGEEIFYRELSDDHIDLLKLFEDNGMKVSLVEDYPENRDIRTDPEVSCHGYFSPNGYALVKHCNDKNDPLNISFWTLDYEIDLLRRGWTKIEGYDIERFTLSGLPNTKAGSAIPFIEKALTEQIEISGKEFADKLKKSGLTAYITSIYMYEREV